MPGPPGNPGDPWIPIGPYEGSQSTLVISNRTFWDFLDLFRSHTCAPGFPGFPERPRFPYKHRTWETKQSETYLHTHNTFFRVLLPQIRLDRCVLSHPSHRLDPTVHKNTRQSNHSSTETSIKIRKFFIPVDPEAPWNPEIPILPLVTKNTNVHSYNHTNEMRILCVCDSHGMKLLTFDPTAPGSPLAPCTPEWPYDRYDMHHFQCSTRCKNNIK